MIPSFTKEFHEHLARSTVELIGRCRAQVRKEEERRKPDQKRLAWVRGALRKAEHSLQMMAGWCEPAARAYSAYLAATEPRAPRAQPKDISAGKSPATLPYESEGLSKPVSGGAAEFVAAAAKARGEVAPEFDDTPAGRRAAEFVAAAAKARGEVEIAVPAPTGLAAQILEAGRRSHTSWVPEFDDTPAGRRAAEFVAALARLFLLHHQTL